ncbi:MAG: hypothetical protein H3C28_09730 [Sphingomonadales bacterium]|nr:hypothetical protein [Sphingomonadales bacterium]
MKLSHVSVLALTVAAGLSLTLARDYTPAPSDDALALLDPATVAKTLCGKQGMNRSVFFRPDFRIGLAQAQAEASPAATPHKQTFDERPPLWPGLGNAEFAISSTNETARAYFNQGLRLAYGFNHWEAARAFRTAQEADRACAICYWGEALVLGHNINAPMAESSVEPAFAAIAKAQVLAAGATPLEQALIAALAARYSPDPKAERAPLNKAYAEAMTKVYQRYPDNDDVAALYAEAVMDTSPWDYYERDFATPHPHMVPAIAAVEAVLARNPAHVGAIHLYIHLTEASTTPQRAEPHADKLAGLAPKAGHLVHMPGHTYFRTGRYVEALNLNVQAVAVDESYLNEVQGSDVYRYGYYPHNVHFVLTSAQMAGDSATVHAYTKKLDALIPFAAAEGVPLAHPVKASVYYALAQYGAPADALAMAEPPASLPYIVAAWRYARGIAYLETGNKTAAAAEAKAIRALGDAPQVPGLEEYGIPARKVFNLAALLIDGRLAAANGKQADAITLLNQAAVAQSAIPYTEPPYWYYPVEQTLGATLLEAKRYGEAADAFSKALIRHPNNAWSLYGLMKAQEAMNDPAAPVTAALYAKATTAKAAPDLARF